MSKELSEMTLEELWQLFPVILVPHQDCWKDWFEEEKQQIAVLLADMNCTINHIGSTAIAGIWAKPIVDILVEIPREISMEKVKERLIHGGYICMWEGERRKSFNKGYTKYGFAQRVFHVHLRFCGDHEELYFRDYMNQNPRLAAEYEKLKRSLWKKYEHDRDGYTEAKGEFVRKYTREARRKTVTDKERR